MISWEFPNALFYASDREHDIYFAVLKQADIMVCNVEQNVGTNIHPEYGVCSEAMLRNVPVPSHIRHVDNCHIYTGRKKWQ